jgi:large-conductance mechanosensitive channel
MVKLAQTISSELRPVQVFGINGDQTVLSAIRQFLKYSKLIVIIINNLIVCLLVFLAQNIITSLDT